MLGMLEVLGRIEAREGGFMRIARFWRGEGGEERRSCLFDDGVKALLGYIYSMFLL